MHYPTLRTKLTGLRANDRVLIRHAVQRKWTMEATVMEDQGEEDRYGNFTKVKPDDYLSETLNWRIEKRINP